jgi:hypothetical protein
MLKKQMETRTTAGQRSPPGLQPGAIAALEVVGYRRKLKLELETILVHPAGLEPAAF